ncbi:MAG TPA: hypothetical protein VMA83_11320 [Solirubrobacteraceae bacterium]|nr:hypothetical protein [Solirubrobacteraceae bacterium]
MNNDDRVTGWWLFAGVLLAIGGFLNIIWGIAAISESHFFVAETHFILSNLNTWGWITLILGVLELIAAFSLFGGGEFGRWFAIIVAALVAIGALFDISGGYPIWSLCVFLLAILIVYELAKGPSTQT